RETHGAQMDAFHRPVMHAGGPQRAAVAAAVAKHAPRVAEAVLVLPESIQDVPVVVRVLLVQSVGDQACPVTAVHAHEEPPLAPGHRCWMSTAEHGSVYIVLRYIPGIETDQPAVRQL